MNETHAVLGVFLITALAFAGYVAVSDSLAGAAVQPYQACCCNILAGDQFGERTLVRSQIQTYAANCEEACTRYSSEGAIFPQQGLCSENP